MKTDSEADPASYPMGTGSSFPGAEMVEECSSPFNSIYSLSLIKAQQLRSVRCVWFWIEHCFQNYQDNFICVCTITSLNTYINTSSRSFRPQVGLQTYVNSWCSFNVLEIWVKESQYHPYRHSSGLCKTSQIPIEFEGDLQFISFILATQSTSCYFNRHKCSGFYFDECSDCGYKTVGCNSVQYLKLQIVSISNSTRCHTLEYVNLIRQWPCLSRFSCRFQLNKLCNLTNHTSQLLFQLNQLCNLTNHTSQLPFQLKQLCNLTNHTPQLPFQLNQLCNLTNHTTQLLFQINQLCNLTNHTSELLFQLNQLYNLTNHTSQLLFQINQLCNLTNHTSELPFQLNQLCSLTNHTPQLLF
jgi:hypothetical protein